MPFAPLLPQGYYLCLEAYAPHPTTLVVMGVATCTHIRTCVPKYHIWKHVEFVRECFINVSAQQNFSFRFCG